MQVEKDGNKIIYKVEPKKKRRKKKADLPAIPDDDKKNDRQEVIENGFEK